MVRKICIDSDFLINFLKGKEEEKNILESLEAEFYTTSVNIFELWYGKKEREPIEELIGSIKVLNFDEKSSIKTAELMLKLKIEGNLIDFRDAFIAGICITNDIELISNNKNHFDRLKKYGLKLI